MPIAPIMCMYVCYCYCSYTFTYEPAHVHMYVCVFSEQSSKVESKLNRSHNTADKEL